MTRPKNQDPETYNAKRRAKYAQERDALNALRRERYAAAKGSPVGAEPRVAEPRELVELARAQAAAAEAKQENQRIVRDLDQALQELDLVHRLASRPLPPIMRRELGSGRRDATAVALLSDLHLETLVLPETTPNGNAFCLEIADLRMRRTFEGIEWLIDHQQSAFEIRDLVLWLGGDIITNHLHEENVETAQLGPVSAIAFAQDRIEAGIHFLLASTIGLERLDIVCSVGNHGRTTKTMRATTAPEHSWEYFMYLQLARTFRDDPRVHVHTSRATHQYHQIYDFKCHFHHGHDVRYGGGVGGISIPMNKATAQWDKVAACDYHFYGHYHQYQDTGAITNNGSLIGFDGYAMSVKATPEPPQQAFCLIDSKRGKSFRAPIWSGDPSREAEIWADVSGHYSRHGKWGL